MSSKVRWIAVNYEFHRVWDVCLRKSNVKFYFPHFYKKILFSYKKIIFYLLLFLTIYYYYLLLFFCILLLFIFLFIIIICIYYYFYFQFITCFFSIYYYFFLFIIIFLYKVFIVIRTPKNNSRHILDEFFLLKTCPFWPLGSDPQPRGL